MQIKKILIIFFSNFVIFTSYSAQKVTVSKYQSPILDTLQKSVGDIFPREILGIISGYAAYDWHKFAEIDFAAVGKKFTPKQLAFQDRMLIAVYDNKIASSLIYNNDSETITDFLNIPEECRDKTSFDTISASNNFIIAGGSIHLNSIAPLSYSQLLIFYEDNKSQYIRTAIWGNGSLISSAVSPNSKFIALGTTEWFGHFKILENINGQFVDKIKESIRFSIQSLRFSPDEKILIAAAKGGKIRFFDTDNFKEYKDVDLQNYNDHYLETIIFLNNTDFLVFGIRNGKIRIWNQNGDIVQDIDHEDNVTSLAVSDDLKILAIGTMDTNRIKPGKIELYKLA